MKKLTNKEILDLYSGATDEEFKNILRISIPSYLSLVNSEKEAAEFLERHGRKFFYSFPERKENGERLLRCAALRKIKVDLDCLDFEVTDAEVLERMDENMAVELQKMLNNYNNTSILHSYEYSSKIASFTRDVIDQYRTIEDDYVKEKMEQKRKVKAKLDY